MAATVSDLPSSDLPSVGVSTSVTPTGTVTVDELKAQAREINDVVRACVEKINVELQLVARDPLAPSGSVVDARKKLYAEMHDRVHETYPVFSREYPVVIRWMEIGRYDERAFVSFATKLAAAFAASGGIAPTRRKFLEAQAEYPAEYVRRTGITVRGKKGTTQRRRATPDEIRKERAQVVKMLYEEDDLVVQAEAEHKKITEETRAAVDKSRREHLMAVLGK
jgi:hypothetical protein